MPGRGRFGSLQTLEAAYADITASRIAVVFPRISRLLRRQRARDVLDYGGGDGLFLQKFLPRGVRRAFHFDASGNMQALAMQRLGGKERFIVLADTASLSAESIDAVALVAVWMESPTRRDALSNLREIHRLLRPHGVLYAAVTDPCFREEKFSSFWTDFSNDRYLVPGAPFTVTVSDGATNATFVDHHWNLGEMSSQLREAGLAIARLYETPDNRLEERPLRGSPWLIIEARKPGR